MLDGAVDQRPRPHCMQLAHKLIQFLRSQTLCQGPGGFGSFLGMIIEDIHVLIFLGTKKSFASDQLEDRARRPSCKLSNLEVLKNLRKSVLATLKSQIYLIFEICSLKFRSVVTQI
jgi:hypothetical protein